jgi:hypothetical protein
VEILGQITESSVHDRDVVRPKYEARDLNSTSSVFLTFG